MFGFRDNMMNDEGVLEICKSFIYLPQTLFNFDL